MAHRIASRLNVMKTCISNDRTFFERTMPP
jgi:hypothetical protein